MKSIKEQAEELEIEVFRTTRSKDVAEKCMWSYIKGAKYVLGEIEKLTNNQNWCAFPKQSHKELKELIEQLKN